MLVGIRNLPGHRHHCYILWISNICDTGSAHAGRLDPIASNKHLILQIPCSRTTHGDCQKFVFTGLAADQCTTRSYFILWAAGHDLENMTCGALNRAASLLRSFYCL